ncbi:MAG: MBL fold metallo-hydrolase [Treponema sp.]|nr:MBL fold metallo-hydrolase [Treponema sp.]
MSSKIKHLTEKISFLPASQVPFSCDIVFIKSKDVTWIFDVGLGPEALKAISNIEGKKNIVISHFHPDHIMNLPLVKYDNLYVSRYTQKYTHSGIILEEALSFEDVKILPMPSSHAKGCLVLLCGEYAFLGDGAFCKYKGSHHLYNVQLLKEMIDFLKSLDCKYFCLSHEKNFVQNKESVIAIYEDIYRRKEEGNPYINVDDFFTSTEAS